MKSSSLSGASFTKSAALILLLLISFSTQAGKDPGLILEKGKYFKKVKNPAISQFNVSFAYSDIKQAGSYKDKWRKLDGKSESAMRVNLVGLSDEVMQRITDTAYKDFRGKLEAVGMPTTELNLTDDLPEWLSKQIGKVLKDGYPERQSHYEAYGAVESKTVPFTGSQVVDVKYPYQVGFVGAQRKKEAISVRYLLHFGYLETSSSKSENDFMNKVSLKTGVTFHPGVQVYWRSGVEVYLNQKKKGSVLIKDNIGAPGDFGRSDWLRSLTGVNLTRSWKFPLMSRNILNWQWMPWRRQTQRLLIK